MNVCRANINLELRALSTRILLDLCQSCGQDEPVRLGLNPGDYDGKNTEKPTDQVKLNSFKIFMFTNGESAPFSSYFARKTQIQEFKFHYEIFPVFISTLKLDNASCFLPARFSLRGFRFSLKLQNCSTQFCGL